MIRVGKRLPQTVPGLAVVVAGFVIGCGGGGGGGSKSAPIIGGSSSGGGIGMTTGSVTTGGTTGSGVTTGSGAGDATTGGGSIDPTTGGGAIEPTTGSQTTGTINPTTGSSTTGSSSTGSATTGTSNPTTGSVDPTTGSSTTGSVDPTTGSVTTGGSSTGGNSTTGSSTTGSSTTGSSKPTTGSSTSGGSTTTTGGSSPTITTTGGLPGPSALRANAIYFGHFADPSVVSSVLPDGSGRQDEGGGAFDVVASIADPDHAGSFVYAAGVNGRYGVYRGATFSPAASIELAAPAFDSVSALQSSGDGAVLVVASSGGVSTALLLANGAVTRIARADDAALSLDGNQVAYSKSYGADSDLYVWDRDTGTSTRLNTGGDAILPSFSKDGVWILFSSTRDRDANGGSAYDLYQIPAVGGAVERITNTPDIDELGGCYNEARSMISYVSYSPDAAETGVFVLSNLGAYRVAADNDLGLATYWTDANGRARTLHRGARFQRFPAKALARARTKAARPRK